jgi:hypothetical protein
MCEKDYVYCTSASEGHPSQKWQALLIIDGAAKVLSTLQAASKLQCEVQTAVQRRQLSGRLHSKPLRLVPSRPKDKAGMPGGSTHKTTDPPTSGALLPDPRWEAFLLRFIELSRVVRVVVTVEKSPR